MTNILSGLFSPKGGRSRKNRKSKSRKNARRRQRTLRGGSGDSRANALARRRN
jgi:hypothetical protein